MGVKRGRSWSLELELEGERVGGWSWRGRMAHAEVRNRPLRVGATHREATKPSEARAERGGERRGDWGWPLSYTTDTCPSPDGSEASTPARNPSMESERTKDNSSMLMR